MIKNKELLEYYYKKSGETRCKNADCVIENDHGFITFNVVPEESMLYICDVCGDGKYWEKFVNLYAKCFGLKRIRFATRRNPKAYERKYGFRVIGYVMEKEAE